jgi:ATP-binding cassette subfamily B protein
MLNSEKKTIKNLRQTFKTSEKNVKIPVKQYLKLFSKYLKPQWRKALVLGILILMTIGMQLISPQVMRYFIDAATGKEISKPLTPAALIYITVSILQQFMSVISTYLGESVGWTATNAMKEDLVSHCLTLDMSFHKVYTPGHMIQRIDDDITALSNFFSRFTIKVLGNILIICGVLGLLCRENIRLGVIMTAFVATTMILLQKARTKSVPYEKDARRAYGDLSGFVEERLSGTEDIRANGAEEYVMRKLFIYLRNRNTKQLKSNIIVNSIRISAVVMNTISTCIGLVVGYFAYKAGIATIGTVFLFIMYIDLIFRPVMQLVQQLEDLQSASVAIQRIDELYSLKPTIIDGNVSELPEGALGVEFDAVDFVYEEGEDKVINDISFKLEAGKVLGILGRTGSGKTTLTRLISRLYDVTSGEVRLDGTNVKDLKISKIREKIGLVTQDVQLFNGSIRDNLTFFNASISDEKIMSVFKELGLMEWFSSLPEGLDTTIISSTSGLSAGEAQLLAMARIFLKNPAIIILDEASSRLDPATENLLSFAIDKLLSGRTGIIVAHRLGTVQRVDEILILESGCIKEHGAREVLLRDSSSAFYNLMEKGMEEVMI